LLQPSWALKGGKTASILVTNPRAPDDLLRTSPGIRARSSRSCSTWCPNAIKFTDAAARSRSRSIEGIRAWSCAFNAIPPAFASGRGAQADVGSGLPAGTHLSAPPRAPVLVVNRQSRSRCNSGEMTVQSRSIGVPRSSLALPWTFTARRNQPNSVSIQYRDASQASLNSPPPRHSGEKVPKALPWMNDDRPLRPRRGAGTRRSCRTAPNAGWCCASLLHIPKDMAAGMIAFAASAPSIGQCNLPARAGRHPSRCSLQFRRAHGSAASAPALNPLPCGQGRSRLRPRQSVSRSRQAARHKPADPSIWSGHAGWPHRRGARRRAAPSAAPTTYGDRRQRRQPVPAVRIDPVATDHELRASSLRCSGPLTGNTAMAI